MAYDKKSAKKDMLKELKKMMRDDMYEGHKGKMDKMKKVTVASDSEEGLEEGLSKAQQLLEMREKMSGEDDMDDMGPMKKMMDYDKDKKKKKQ